METRTVSFNNINFNENILVELPEDRPFFVQLAAEYNPMNTFYKINSKLINVYIHERKVRFEFWSEVGKDLTMYMSIFANNNYDIGKKIVDLIVFGKDKSKRDFEMELERIMSVSSYKPI